MSNRESLTRKIISAMSAENQVRIDEMMEAGAEVRVNGATGVTVGGTNFYASRAILYPSVQSDAFVGVYTNAKGRHIVRSQYLGQWSVVGIFAA